MVSEDYRRHPSCFTKRVVTYRDGERVSRTTKVCRWLEPDWRHGAGECSTVRLLSFEVSPLIVSSPVSALTAGRVATRLSPTDRVSIGWGKPTLRMDCFGPGDAEVLFANGSHLGFSATSRAVCSTWHLGIC